MSDWPDIRRIPGTPAGVYSTAFAMLGMNNAGVASTSWPAANLALFVPMRVGRPEVIYKLAVGAGSTAAGNFDVGVYDAQGNLLVSSGATAKGASTEHVIDIADTLVGPGIYYLALAADGTNNYVMHTPSGTSPVPLQKQRLYGTLEAASAYTLPSAVTFAACTNVGIPMIAAYTRPH